MLKQGIGGGPLLLLLLTTTALAESEGEGGGGGLFSGSFGEAVWTVLAFVGLLLVLRKFAWGALLEGLQSREQHIRGEIDQAETARRRAETLLAESEGRGEALVKSLTEKAQRDAHRVLEQARREAAAAKEQARADIEQARAAALDRVRGQAVDLVATLTAEVMGRAANPEVDEPLIREALKGLGDGRAEGEA